MNPARTFWLSQALLVTFLWSASKIIMKLGLGLVSPLVMAAGIQTVAFIGLAVYYWWRHSKIDLRLSRQQIQALVVSGIGGFVVAPLFSVIGLKYVSGTTAGLLAGLNVILVMVLGNIILRERPQYRQIMGALLAVVGVYVFLSDGAVGGTAFGILMLLLAELGYALDTVLSRFVMRQPGDAAMATTLIESGIGVVVLLPIGLLSGGNWGALGQWQVLLSIVVVGLIFGFAGMMWNSILDKLQAMEAAILQNTMLIQIAVLSVIFLGERPTLHNVLGGIGVLIGAYLVDYQVKTFVANASTA